MPAAPIDVRAQAFSNLGPVISGQLSDDPLQPGVGLLRTQGEVVISGLIQPAKGTEITIGVRLPGGTLTRFPRRLRVIKAESDPIENQTTLTVGCLLALKWDLVKAEIFYADENPQWTPVEPTAAGSTPNICHLSTVVATCLTRCGITQAGGNPAITGAKAMDSIDLSDGYLEVASRILGEAGLYGFIDAAETLRLRQVLAPASTGPLLAMSDLITMEPIGDPAAPDEILVEYTAVEAPPNYKPKNPDDKSVTWNTDDQNAPQGGSGYARNWTYQKTISPVQTYEIEYQRTVGNTKVTFQDSVSFVSESVNQSFYSTISYKDKDGKIQKQDVLSFQTSDTTTCSAAVNPTEWKSKREGGSGYNPLALQVKATRVSKSYKITEDGPVETRQVTEEYEPLIAFAGGLAIENYNGVNIAQYNFLVRKTVVNKTENKASDVTLQKTTVYQAWGATSSGKTIASATMKIASRLNDTARVASTIALFNRMSTLVCSGSETVFNRGRGQIPVPPKEVDEQNNKLDNIQNDITTNSSLEKTDPRGEAVPQLVTLQFGQGEASSTGKYDMQYAPDSYLRPANGAGDNDTGMTFVNGASSAAAYTYGKVVHAILSGMANGKSITTEFRNIPSEPLAGIFIEASGTIGKFRANGITYAFDAQGLVAGCDAMLDGGAGLVAGGSGADWFPMAVPATNLSTLTPAVNSTPALANTITAPVGFNPAAPGNIWSSLGTAGAGSDVYAAAVTKAAVVGSVAETVRRESVSRSLSWLLTADYDMTPQTLSLVSVTMNYGTLQAFTVAENPGVAWVTNVTTFEPGARSDGQGYNEGVAWVTPATTFTPGGANNGPNPGVAWVTPATTFTPGARTDGVGSNPGVQWVTPATTFTPGARSDGRSVLLLLHMDGADNGTVFTDSSSYARTITRIGSVVTRTNVKKFGTASLRGEVNGYLRFSPAITLSGDITIATWFSANSITLDQALFGFDSILDNNQVFRLNEDGITGNLIVYSNAYLWDRFNNYLSGLTSEVFNHYELTRQGTTVRLFINGNLLATVTFSGSISINTIGAGYAGNSNQIFGNMDEVIILSECLHTASFTPPTAPYSNG
jgi:hypothetical protein